MHVLLWALGLIALAALVAFIASRGTKKPPPETKAPEPTAALEPPRPPTIDLRTPDLS